MKSPKKTPLSEKETIGPGAYRITVGTGANKRSKVIFENNFPKVVKDAFDAFFGYFSGKHSFDGSVFFFEDNSKKILTEAGFPVNAGVIYTLPDGVVLSPTTYDETSAILSRASHRKVGELPDLVISHGCRERESPEWYAAQFLLILHQTRIALSKLSFIKGNVAKQVANLAYGLGELSTEARGLNFFKKMGGMGGTQERRKLPIDALIRSLLRKDPKGTAKKLWNMIPTDLWYGVRIKGYKFYRNGGRILALGKVEGFIDWRPVGKPLKFDAFRKHLTKARKPPTR